MKTTNILLFEKLFILLSTNLKTKKEKTHALQVSSPFLLSAASASFSLLQIPCERDNYTLNNFSVKLRSTRFPELGASYTYLLRILIGLLHLLRLARAISLVFGSVRHSLENRSIHGPSSGFQLCRK